MPRLTLLFSMLILSLSASGEKLVDFHALDKKILISIPEQFGPMSKEILEIKYPTENRPTEVISNNNGQISIGFSHTAYPIKPEEITLTKKTISESFRKIHPSAIWFRNEIIQQYGTEFFVLELITPAIDTKIHNIMYGTSLENRLLIISFNTTIEQSDAWLSIGKKIMKSIYVERDS